MTQPELYDAISIAFYNLAQVNQMIYDYWLMELYDEEGEIIAEQWTEENLNLMWTPNQLAQGVLCSHKIPVTLHLSSRELHQ